jgi:hypothetical protein
MEIKKEKSFLARNIGWTILTLVGIPLIISRVNGAETKAKKSSINTQIFESQKEEIVDIVLVMSPINDGYQVKFQTRKGLFNIEPETKDKDLIATRLQKSQKEKRPINITIDGMDILAAKFSD